MRNSPLTLWPPSNTLHTVYLVRLWLYIRHRHMTPEQHGKASNVRHSTPTTRSIFCWKGMVGGRRICLRGTPCVLDRLLCSKRFVANHNVFQEIMAAHLFEGPFVGTTPATGPSRYHILFRLVLCPVRHNSEFSRLGYVQRVVVR